MKHAMIKKLIKFLIFIFILSCAYFSYQYYANNKTASWPENAETQESFDKAVDWLSTHYSSIKDTYNPALWWMLKKASDINDNKKLARIYQQYKTEYLDPNPANIWTPYFRTFYRPLVPDITAFSDYAPYQVFFAYALSCNKTLEQEPIIQQQLEADYCGMHYLNPRCVTHQLMSVRLMQERFCGDDTQLATLSLALQETIVDELTVDFRVTDSYLQRVLALAEAGNFDAIKPVWLQRIIKAQNNDGGWGDMHSIITISDTKSIGWTSTLPGYTSSESKFHATAQGIWLMALLLQKNAIETEAISPVESAPVEPSPVESDPVESDPVEPSPVEPGRVKPSPEENSPPE